MPAEDGRTLVIFDGGCRGCRAVVGLLAARAGGGVQAEARQEADLAALGLSQREAAAGLLWWDNGLVWHGHLALARLLERSGRGGAALAALLTSTPVDPWTALGYELLRRRRHPLGQLGVRLLGQLLPPLARAFPVAPAVPER